MSSHDRFVTTSRQGLRHDSPPMRLYQQAKRAAAWDPRSIDFSADARHWTLLSEPERDLLLRLTALFQAGEEGMTLDMPPLLTVVTRERRLEEALFLSTLLADEAKHTEFFRRVLDDVCGATGDLHGYHTPSFRGLFYETLPRLMNRLLHDPSPVAQAEALVAYTIIGEGVLSETGHHLYMAAVRYRGLLPSLLAGLGHVQRDESRHMTFGVYMLSRLVAQDPAVWPAVQRCMNLLLAQALEIVSEFFASYDVAPFGLTLEDTVSYAMGRFARRSARVERANTGGTGTVEAAGDPAAEVWEWLAEEVTPHALERATSDAGVMVVRVPRAGGAASLLITPELLERYLGEEIVAALHEQAVPARLTREPGIRLICLDGGGRIVVQSPPAGADHAVLRPSAGRH